MGRIGTGVFQLGTALVVELKDQGAVPAPALDGSHLLRVMPFPEAALSAERTQAAFNADTRPGQDDDLFPVRHICLK